MKRAVHRRGPTGLTVVWGVAALSLCAAGGCRFDPSGVRPDTPPDCGNGVLDPAEECDATDLGGQSCTQMGYTGGELACSGQCTFDVSSCDGTSLCGNSVLDGTEECDTTEFDGQSCESLLHHSGVLGCRTDCTLDETNCLDVRSDWFDEAWAYRKRIRVFESQVPEDQPDFAVMVQLLSDPELQAAARPDGWDILFTAADGQTQLMHELERYESSSGSLAAWVKVPLLSSTSDTVVFMYYGNATSGEQQSPPDVWDSAFAGVYHLRHDGSQQYMDSTSAGHHATASYVGNLTAAGRIGPGQQLNGTDEHLEIPSVVTAGLTLFTVCLWVRTDESGIDSTYWHRPSLFGQSTFGDASGDFGITTNNGVLGLWSGLNTSDNEHETSNSINDLSWYHVCAANDGGTIELYLNSFLVGTLPSGGALNAQQFWLGGRAGEGGGGDHHAGIFDELQISSVYRSEAWIQTAYANQGLPGNFYEVGTEVYFLQ